MEEEIIIQICWFEDEEGKKVYDIEGMREEFETKLGELEE